MKIGDVVFLKSGGPSMTIIVVDDDMVVCSWFLRDCDLERRARFPRAAIELAERVPQGQVKEAT